MQISLFHKKDWIIITLFSIIVITLMPIQSTFGFNSKTDQLFERDCPLRSQYCICDMDYMYDAIHSLITAIKSPPKIIERLRNYKCHLIQRLPPTLEVEVSSLKRQEEFDDEIYKRRRLIYKKRRKRQVYLGSPKDDLFYNLVEVADDDVTGNHEKGMLGGDLKLPCYPKDFDPYELGTDRTFSWIRESGKAISDRFVNEETGYIYFPQLFLTDSDIYNCTVKYKDVKYNMEQSKVFSHQLSVVSVPTFILRMTARYTTTICDRSELNSIQDIMTNKMISMVCPMCNVENITSACIKPDGEQTGDDYSGDRHYQFKMSISFPMGRFVEMITYKLDPFHCPLICAEAVNNKLYETIRDSIVKFFSLPIKAYGKDLRFHSPIPEYFKPEALEGCIGGFHIKNKLCFPCNKGTYSPNAASDCFKCPLGTFQHSTGSTDCLLCDPGYDTMHEGSESEWSCLPDAIVISARNKSVKWIIISSLLIFLGVVLILIFVAWCFPRTGCGKCLRKLFGCLSTTLFYLFCCCCCFRRKSKFPNIRKLEKEDKKKLIDKDEDKQKNVKPKNRYNPKIHLQKENYNNDNKVERPKNSFKYKYKVLPTQDDINEYSPSEDSPPPPEQKISRKKYKSRSPSSNRKKLKDRSRSKSKSKFIRPPPPPPLPKLRSPRPQSLRRKR